MDLKQNLGMFTVFTCLTMRPIGGLWTEWRNVGSYKTWENCWLRNISFSRRVLLQKVSFFVVRRPLGGLGRFVLKFQHHTWFDIHSRTVLLESRHGQDVFCPPNRPDSFCGPHSLLFIGYRSSFPAVRPTRIVMSVVVYVLPSKGLQDVHWKNLLFTSLHPALNFGRDGCNFRLQVAVFICRPDHGWRRHAGAAHVIETH